MYFSSLCLFLPISSLPYIDLWTPLYFIIMIIQTEFWVNLPEKKSPPLFLLEKILRPLLAWFFFQRKLGGWNFIWKKIEGAKTFYHKIENPKFHFWKKPFLKIKKVIYGLYLVFIDIHCTYHRPLIKGSMVHTINT